MDASRPQVILSKNYLDEVKNATEEWLSFPLYSIQVSTSAQQGPTRTDGYG
jgi:hypothetical protein